MHSIHWLFFDVGSTLVGETEAYNHRIHDAIAGTDITFAQFMEKRIEFAKQNRKGDLEAIKFFGLQLTPWRIQKTKCSIRMHPECSGIYQHLDADHPTPDYTVNGLSELLEIFSSPSHPSPDSITQPDRHEAG